MDDREKEQKEQEMLKKTYKFSVSSHIFVANAAILILGILCLVKAFQYMMMDSRTPHDNEQMIMCIVMLFILILLGIFNSFWAPKLMVKLIGRATEKQENKNTKTKGQIHNLQSALQKMSGAQGIIVWDTVWGSISVFMIVAFIIFYKTCNKTAVLGVIIFLLVMLFGGHMIGTIIGKRRHFDKKLCKYTKLYMDISDENTYIADLDASIQNDVIAFTGYWLLTDDYMIGRLSDISYEPIAIPRTSIVRCVFFFEIRINGRGLPIGILRLQLNNEKCVEFVLGRGNICNQTLRVLNEQRIPWSKEGMRYS